MTAPLRVAPEAEGAVARIAERCDYPGEAAECIATELRISFGAALALVRQWEARP